MLESSVTSPDPTDIPEIVDAYTALIGKVIGKFARKDADKTGKGLDGRDISALVALGRTIAMFQATEEMRISRVGGKAVREMTTADLRKRLGAAQVASGDAVIDSPEPEEAELE